jgi:GNAT superfamily N-acetyltransferase
MKFEREILTVKLWEEMFPLFEKHYEEIAHHKDIPLDPDITQYMKLEEIGALRAFIARDEAGLIAGYAVYFIRYNLHYRSSLQALQDVLFIDPERRGFGAKFMLWCDDELKKEGIQITYHHVKQAHNFGPLLERMGYKLVDLIYTRRLN